MKKVGIIRCQQTEDVCPGTTDFKVASQGKLAFEETGPVEIIGFVSCGGCPGKRAIARAKMMVERGAKAIVFASCISRGKPRNINEASRRSACMPAWPRIRRTIR